MDTTLMIIVLAALVVAAGLWAMSVQRRRTHLREQFGPEYARTVDETGSRSKAERSLAEREARVRKLSIRPLTMEQRSRFADEWRHVQARFVDSPSAAVADADHLVAEVMQARGYPVQDLRKSTEDVSVDHATVVHHFRSALTITERSRLGDASTEDLRQAMVHYRALFEDLLESHEHEEVEHVQRSR